MPGVARCLRTRAAADPAVVPGRFREKSNMPSTWSAEARRRRSTSNCRSWGRFSSRCILLGLFAAEQEARRVVFDLTHQIGQVAYQSPDLLDASGDLAHADAADLAELLLVACDDRIEAG